ncbi:MAG: hypothetical protein GX760_02640 [Erysipelothrix sp.]|nr:hypothetical protein [Erysipelothrix sp.]
MIILQNHDYFVKLNLEGGQVSRFKDEHSGIEYIFEANPQYWGYSTPTLFPIIGSSYDKKYHFESTVTTMENHGILRSATFTNVSNFENCAVLTFTSNDETFAQYPYHFTINITYTLEGSKLLIEYDIINDGVVDMPFNFGLHPAFSVPLTKDKTFNDFKVTFSSPEVLRGHGPMTESGLISEIPLDYKTFSEYPTWIYHNLQSSHIGLSDGTHGVNVSVVGFPVVAVWTNADKEAPFVCLEPWLGLKHDIERDLPFEKRDAILSISPSKQFRVTYTIEVF